MKGAFQGVVSNYMYSNLQISISCYQLLLVFIYFYYKLLHRHFDWFLLMIYWRTDAQIISPLKTICFFHHIKQIESMLQWLCLVIYHTRHQYLVRMSMTHLALYGVLPFCSCHILRSYLTYKTDNMQSIFFIKEGFVDLV